MKADYLRYVYECLSGDNGLMAAYSQDEFKVDLSYLIRQRHQDAVRHDGDDVDIVESEIFYSIYSNATEKNIIKSAK